MLLDRIDHAPATTCWKLGSGFDGLCWLARDGWTTRVLISSRRRGVRAGEGGSSSKESRTLGRARGRQGLVGHIAAMRGRPKSRGLSSVLFLPTWFVCAPASARLGDWVVFQVRGRKKSSPRNTCVILVRQRRPCAIRFCPDACAVCPCYISLGEFLSVRPKYCPLWSWKVFSSLKSSVYSSHDFVVRLPPRRSLRVPKWIDTPPYGTKRSKQIHMKPSNERRVDGTHALSSWARKTKNAPNRTWRRTKSFASAEKAGQPQLPRAIYAC